MENNGEVTFTDLVKYVNAVGDLAESIEADIKAGSKISNKTVLRLSKLISAANKIEHVISHIDNLQ